MASALGEIETFGLPKDYYATYADAVRNASDAQVNAAAKQFVDPGRIGADRLVQPSLIDGARRRLYCLHGPEALPSGQMPVI